MKIFLHILTIKSLNSRVQLNNQLLSIPIQKIQNQQ